MKRKVILTHTYQEEALRQLREEFDLIMVENSGKTLEDILKENPDTEAIIGFLSDKIDKTIIDLGKNVKIIANYAVGYNNIDVHYAREKGILVTNTPDILTDTTADMTIALMLAVARRIVEGDEIVRKGLFKGWTANFMLGKDLKGCTLGIVGMGRIGLAAAVRALQFGMKIIYFSRTMKPELEDRFGFRYTPFLELVRAADVVSLHIPSTPETRRLFNKDVFDLMKHDAIFLNVSRGDLMDEAYLAEKLEKNELFGAGLDVYEFEPNVNERLIRLKNAVLAPHVGSATYTTRLGMAQLTVDNVRQVLSGLHPQNLVKEFNT